MIRAVPDKPVRLGGSPAVGAAVPCPSVQRAVLGAVDAEGCLIRCGLLAGHDGAHEFRITWTGPGVRLIPEVVSAVDVGQVRTTDEYMHRYRPDEAQRRADAARNPVEVATERTKQAIREFVAGLCRHCGAAPDADGDHSCSCPYTDAECLDHPPVDVGLPASPEQDKQRCEHGKAEAHVVPCPALAACPNVKHRRPCPGPVSGVSVPEPTDDEPEPNFDTGGMGRGDWGYG